MITVYEWIGYIASIIVLVSLLMSSIKRLRWVNLVGATIFSVYGFLIGALPVGVMNAGIVLINIYYLFQIYTKKDYFTLLKMNRSTEYFKYFMSFHKDNMSSFMKIEENLDDPKFSKLFILRNTIPAGIVVSRVADDETLEIMIDYVVPAYRDFKVGKFLYDNQKDFFIEQGYKKLISRPINEKHQDYFRKMGFSKQQINDKSYYVKELL